MEDESQNPVTQQMWYEGMLHQKEKLEKLQVQIVKLIEIIEKWIQTNNK